MEREDKILAHPEFQVYMRRIREQERTRVFCLHGIEHSLDVARIGYIKNLEQGLSFRQDVIYAMALLHDIGRCEEYASGKSHHEAGAELARPILLACGYTEHECAEICDAIGRHKAPSEQARSLATLLYDADKRAAVRHVPVVEVYETVLLHVTHPFIQIKMLYASGVER